MSAGGSPNYDAIFPSDPGPNTGSNPPPTGPTSYADLPWYRKSGVCSGIIVSHLVVGVVSRCVPFVGLLGLLTTVGVIAVCISALTGPIYFNKSRKDGTLRTWSRWNKVAAVIILVLFIGGYAALLWFLFSSGQLGVGGPNG